VEEEEEEEVVEVEVVEVEVEGEEEEGEVEEVEDEGERLMVAAGAAQQERQLHAARSPAAAHSGLPSHLPQLPVVAPVL
jgi:hypothetical protein